MAITLHHINSAVSLYLSDCFFDLFSSSDVLILLVCISPFDSFVSLSILTLLSLLCCFSCWILYCCTCIHRCSRACPCLLIYSILSLNMNQIDKNLLSILPLLLLLHTWQSVPHYSSQKLFHVDVWNPKFGARVAFSPFTISHWKSRAKSSSIYCELSVADASIWFSVHRINGMAAPIHNDDPTLAPAKCHRYS
jgi:hypothetical protein